MSDDHRTLLLLHPAATLSGVWAPLRRGWAEQWHVLAPNLLPDGPPATQLRRWATAAALQIASSGGRPSHVVGASLGASVALRLALDPPALVASLVLDSAQLGGPLPPKTLRYIGRLIGSAAARLPARLVAAALLTQFPAYQGADREAVRVDIRRLGVTGIIGHLHAQLSHDVRAEAGHITLPTLLLAGERDPLTRSGAHRALQAALPQARIVEVPGAGHVTFLSRPDALRRELAAWVR